jgi:1,4-dihydroxy-2-naphthoate polyprenyltransferase
VSSVFWRIIQLIKNQQGHKTGKKAGVKTHRHIILNLRIYYLTNKSSGICHPTGCRLPLIFRKEIMGIYQKWFLACRPWSFSLTAVSVSIGSILGSDGSGFSWFLFLLTLTGVVFAHASGNLLNDYFDVRSGVDTVEVSTAQYRPHPLAEGRLKPGDVLLEALVFLGIAASAGIYLAVTRGWMVLWISLAAAFALIFYTAPPFKYKYKALGEIAVFLMWGPLMVEGAYFVQAGNLNFNALLISLPLGILVALVLLANNIRDIRDDAKKGIKTVPILTGKKKGIWVYIVLVAAAYTSVILMSLLGPLNPWSLIVLVSVPLFFKLLRQIIQNPPLDADARTAQLNTAFGILLLISIIIGNLP